MGAVNVLLVSVWEPVSVATVLSIATDMLLLDIVVVNPVPPAIVSVSVPIVTLSLLPLSAASVRTVDIAAVVTLVISPLPFTVITGIAVVEPKAPVVLFTVANVEFSVAFARLVTVTVPVVSPVCVIVKSATSKLSLPVESL